MIPSPQSITSNQGDGDDLSSLISNNSLTVYIDGQALNTADINSIYLGSPAANANYVPPAGGAADPNYVPPAGGAADPNYVPPAGGAAGSMPGTSCFTIEFNDGSYLKAGQTVFVTYNAAGGLQDSNGNSISPFSQLVTNSSSLANDRTNPTITGSPSINPDGNSFQLKFSEDISKDSLTSFDTNQFKLFVDGVEQTAGSFFIDPSQFGGPLGDAGAPAADAPINEITVQINGSTIEVGQNVLLSYATNDPNGSTGITDTSGNNLANFTYQLENFSSQDYTAPEITEGNVDLMVPPSTSMSLNLLDST